LTRNQDMYRPPPNETLVILGGSVHGLEAAALARIGGARVTVVEAGERVMQAAASPKIAALFTAAHRASGVEILTDTAVTSHTDRSATLVDGRKLIATRVLEADPMLPPDPHHFTTTQFDLVLQTAGPWHTADATLLRRREEGPGVTFLHTKSDRLVAIESVNDPDTFAAAAALLAARAHIDMKAAADGTHPLADAVLKPAAARSR
jgi:threonine dehydrogenase-like Zn-dependent dehydrogenase